MLLHDGKVHGVTSREPAVTQDNFLRTLDHALINNQHLVDDSKQRVERSLDGVAAINRDVSMKNLLQHLSIRHQTLTVAD